MLLMALALGCGAPSLGGDTGFGITPTDDSATESASPDDSQPINVDVRLYINEFMASNGSYAFDNGEDEVWTPDWIELYNPAEVPVPLAGFTITDDLDVPDKHVLGEVVVPAQGYLLLFADGTPELGPNHVGFKLSSTEEAVGLFGPEGQPLDRITYTNQVTNFSAARVPDAGPLMLTSDATPGASNPSSAE